MNTKLGTRKRRQGWAQEAKEGQEQAEMNIRLATRDDAQLLLAWRNDPLTRAMSKSLHEVQWDEHVRWLNSRLTRIEPHLYIAEIDGAPVGTIRIDGDEISYTVAPEHRGRGYATEMLRWAHAQFGSLRAEIKPENVASVKAAERAGHKVELLS